MSVYLSVSLCIWLPPCLPACWSVCWYLVCPFFGRSIGVHGMFSYLYFFAYVCVVFQVLTEGTMFGRMSPLDKEHLVEEFQKAGFYVAMCGDGVNDCGV